MQFATWRGPESTMLSEINERERSIQNGISYMRNIIKHNGARVYTERIREHVSAGNMSLQGPGYRTGRGQCL